MSNITVTFDDGRVLECPEGTLVGSLTDSPASPDGFPWIAALVNNDCASLSYPLSVNCTVRFLTLADRRGWRIYRNSLCFLLAKTVREVFPEAQFSVEHSFGVGLYCSFRLGEGEDCCTESTVKELEAAMRERVDRDIPIEWRKMAFTEAVRELDQSGQEDKLNLLKFRNPPRVVMHWCDGFKDLAHGPIVPSTGVLKQFGLKHYRCGFVLCLPGQGNPGQIAPFEDQPHLFDIIQEHKEWGRILGVNTIGRLNETIAGGQIDEFVRTAEALHEKKLWQITSEITNRAKPVKLILIAGPSCAGKTTFAKRLSTHLRVNGLRPISISTDDYFVGDARNPRDEDGKPDYEHIEAVDLELFNTQLTDLVDGRTIEPVHFDFQTKQRVVRGETLSLNGGVLIVEGIHALNPRLTASVPPDTKYGIYVNALTQLSIDANNRISTTDNRLIRRMVRDHKYRNHNALKTLQVWPSVRRGEKRWIFPFQKLADATFNSALDYELAVLKLMVEPLLMQVKPSHAEYAETRRLTEFLLGFLATPANPVPQESILREYIGGSGYDY